MEVEAAKMIGAGLAVIALAGVGVGIGNIFSALVTSILLVASEWNIIIIILFNHLSYFIAKTIIRTFKCVLYWCFLI